MTIKKLKSIDIINVLSDLLSEKLETTVKLPMKLYDKCRRELIRRIGIARPMAVTFRRINQIVMGWINYYRIGVMKYFVDVFGQWLRHKIRVIILKQWKRPRRISI